MHLFCLLWFGFTGLNFDAVKSKDCLLDEARKLIGIKEVGGNNRGPEVDKIIISSGGKPGQAWCAYTQVFIHKKCRLSHANGMALSWFIKPRIIHKNQYTQGDVFSVYNSGLRRIGHVGLIEQVLPSGKFIVTIEGNTSGGGSREGDGVYRLTRSTKNVYSFARWWN
jgi:hypothetical protein